MMINHNSTTPAKAPQATSAHSVVTQKKSKRRPKDPEHAHAQAFLRQALSVHKRTLHLAWLMDVASVLLLTAQVLCLSAFFAACLQAQFDGVLTMALAQAELFKVLPWLALCLLLRPLIGFVRERLVSDVGHKLATSARVQGLARLGELSAARYHYGSDGALASYVIDEPDALMGYARFSVQKKTAVTTPIILALIIVVKSVTAALVLLLTAPLVPIFMALIGIATARKSREQMDAMAQLSARFLDWVRGTNTLVRLSAADVARRDLAQAAEEYKKRTMRVLGVAFLNSAVLEWLSALSIALVAVYLGFGLMGILPWAKGELLTDYHTALFILLLVPEFYAPLRRLGADYHAKGTAEAAAKQLVHFLAAPKVAPPMQPSIADVAPAQAFTDKVAPELVLDRVSVLGDGGRMRLYEMSLHVKSGQRVAVIGPSGAGKSTLLQLLLGVSTYRGMLVVNGEDFLHIDRTAWQRSIGYLAQVPALLPMTIRDNLLLANANASDAELQAVLTQVGLAELVNALPDGLATRLSERGGGLSGGQAQRLAIAQLLLQDATLWLLDEPSEHLDVDTRLEIQALLLQVSSGKTVLWATHDSDFIRSGVFDELCHLSAHPLQGGQDV